MGAARTVDDDTRDAVEDALSSGEVLGMEHVRRVAGWWHGGQWSALYALCSSGHIDWSRLESEIDEISGDDGLAMASWWESLPVPPAWEIQDWTGKVLFDGYTFPSFESAWEHIYSEVPSPEEDGTLDSAIYDEYFAVQVSGDEQ